MNLINQIRIKLMNSSNYISYLRTNGVKIGEDCEIYKSVNFGSEPYLISLGNHVRINAGVQLITHDGGMWVLRSDYSGFADKYKNADKLLNNYIQDNSKSLREIAKETFDKFISHKEDYNSIKENAVKNYIYQLDNDTLEFKVNTSKYERSSDINKLMMKYLEFPEETEYKVFEEYINNEEKTEYLYSRVLGIANIELTVREKIGERLLEKDLEDKLIVELKNDPTNEYKIKHDIIESIKDIDAQMLTINLCHNGKEISFKYPKDQLYNFWLSDYHIQEVSKREEIKQMYKDERGFDDFHLEDIKSISFRKQILYENNKELELNNEKEEPDIVDDMFD